MLRGLGWDIVRIWSTDWWIDAPGTLEKIHAQLEALMAGRRAETAAEEDRAAELAQRAIAAAKSDSGAEPTTQRTESDAGNPVKQGTIVATDISVGSPTTYARNSSTPIDEASPGNAFIEIDLATTDHVADAEQFFERGYDSRLLAMVEHVVKAEGPIRDEVLARRIARAHGWSRTGARILERVVDLTKRHFHGDGNLQRPRLMVATSNIQKF